MDDAISSSESEAKARSKRTRTLAAGVTPAAIATFLFGYYGAILSATLPFMVDQLHLTPTMCAFAENNGLIGAIFGSFIGGWLCDKIGREKTLTVCVALVGLATLMPSLATIVMIPGGLTISTFSVLNTSRIVGGFAMGLASVASPIYFAEIAPPQMRGKLGLIYQLAFVTGLATAPIAAYPISLYFPVETAWHWMLASQLVIVAIFFLVRFLFVQVPSPRWLAEKGRFKEALDVLKKIHEPSLAESEFVEIKASVDGEQGGWGQLLLPGVRFALLIGCLLAFFNNATGWSAIGGSVTTLIELSGVKSHSTTILRFAFTYVAMTIMTVISLLLVDRVGRRPLWIFSSMLMALVMFVTGEVFFFHLHGLIVLLILILCTVPHGIALGGLPWLMIPELFPTRVRARAVALATTFLWIAIYSFVYYFPILFKGSTDSIGSAAGVFWLFAFICVLSTMFGFTIMPETKGRTLEEIARSWNKK